jgi:hypothetical protein
MCVHEQFPAAPEGGMVSSRGNEATHRGRKTMVAHPSELPAAFNTRDVERCSSDGMWGYVIDAPFGIKA